ASVILSGDSNDVKLKGYYESEKLDLNVDIQQVRMKSLEAFASKYIRKSSGYLSGGIRITGKATEPKMNGKLTFHNAGMNLVAINNTVLLKNETIQVSNEGIHFADFTVLDPKGQPMNVKGDVLSSNFTDMKFNLDITTRNFTVMNTTAKDNPVYYGTLILNSTLKIRGDQNLPVLTANGTLLDNSTFTFVVLEGDLSTSRGEDVVVFEDSVRVRTVTSKDTVRMKTEYKGIDLNANIEVNKNSVFRVIVDPESGDNLEVSGDANLAFGIDPGGKVSLSGVYILNDGHYQASFQKVIKREFKIKTGSRITWSGDPMDGQIDLTAIYKTQAGATDLMANELAGVSENERIAYRKLLTYNVNLIINGPILKPQLQFNLDMPPADQLAFGGLVYAKVNMLNTDPNELNKQVFSLLVLNKFIPTGSAGVSTGSAVSTLARNSVNQMLTDQLNVLSGRYVKGAAVNFNLQTTEDYNAGAAQQNTALQVGVKKELFNSRLSLQVGSSIDLSGSKQNTSNSNGQSLTGDVQVEYKLTPDGRLRLKAFRENQYEGVIDGILYKTGLGFSYTRDYNYFRELWKSPHKETKP
ncbi:MAG TPA: translocation/assembly module TamB domain-containing protein, partial [Catalimonadaceae bacterium]|nr:translocation/assembly module TamB domain-containing protein [Catalimonadaceae bacterium]